MKRCLLFGPSSTTDRNGKKHTRRCCHRLTCLDHDVSSKICTFESGCQSRLPAATFSSSHGSISLKTCICKEGTPQASPLDVAWRRMNVIDAKADPHYQSLAEFSVRLYLGSNARLLSSKPDRIKSASVRMSSLLVHVTDILGVRF